MSFEQRGAAWAALMGTVGAGIAVTLLGLRYSDSASVVVGFGFGVAVVGFVLSVGMTGWVYLSDASGDSLYIYPATVAAASVLLLVAAGDHPPEGTPTRLSLVLVGAAVLIVVGFTLVFVSQLRERRP
ncbi:MAG: hypothetical protein ABEH77_03385 [Halobacteriaceae archaeon]